MGVLRCSRWYRSNPAPGSGGPTYVNGVALVETTLEPAKLLALLHRVEAQFERVRTDPGAPRTLDLDLLAFGDAITGPGETPTLPHPRMQERAFVLLPLAEVAPQWRHPASGLGVRGMIEALPRSQVSELLEDGID